MWLIRPIVFITDGVRVKENKTPRIAMARHSVSRCQSNQLLFSPRTLEHSSSLIIQALVLCFSVGILSGHLTDAW